MTLITFDILVKEIIVPIPLVDNIYPLKV